MGNLRHPITQTPLPGAKKAYGQLLSRDFNPLDIPPITANGLSPISFHEREYKRRSDTAAKVADFVNQLANRNQALRQLAIAASMEQRAQIRVNEGIADADEQIKWLDKVATLENALITAEAKAMDARLTLVSMCRDGEADHVNAYLTDLAQLPDKAKP